METVEDIVREMRKTVSIIADKKSEGSDILSVWSILSTFADRIEKAHGESLRCQAELLKEYRAENARIKAALKPVLDYAEHWTMSDSERSSRRLIAIKEARSIYNEGSEK